MSKQIIRGGPNGMKIELDTDQIFPDDPGQGTPVIVSMKHEGVEVTGTWNCVTSEGEVDGIPITPEQRYWLEARRTQVENWEKKHGV